MNIRVQSMTPRIRPLLPSMRVWGEARTARFVAVSHVPEKPFELEMKLVDDLKEGQILVSQCETSALSAAWGGLLTAAAQSRKARGVITDGGVRDYTEIVALDFPTFCAGLTPYDSLGRMDMDEIDLPITCGGISVAPGDLVFADVDGVVVVPSAVVDEVIAKAWEKIQAEDQVRRRLRSGASVSDTFQEFGVL
jgi:4-hydroxy-4-methyl-2-oxoglutarate aldolase